MSFNSGTNLFSYFQEKMNMNSILNSYTSFQVSGTLKGSINTQYSYHKTTENDIICGKSICGSREQPTWEYCFK